MDFSSLCLHLCFRTHLQENLQEEEAGEQSAQPEDGGLLKSRSANPPLKSQPGLWAHLIPSLGIILGTTK